MALFAAILATGGPLGGLGPLGSTLPRGSMSAVPVAVGLGPQVAQTPSTFWGVVVQTRNATGITQLPVLGALINSTPFEWFSYTLDTDQCNLSADVFYSNNGTPSAPCPFSVPAFITWCDSRAPRCQSILKLPGENNNSAEDAYYANYIVHTLGFQPSYWTIGNEPMLWTHYDLPWSEWRTTDHSVPTPIAYAYDVKAAIAAVRQVDPAGRFIGIESDCECSGNYISAVAAVDGANISAIGYHTYPSTALQTYETLSEFFAPLTSKYNITTSYATVRNAVTPECATCGSLPILVTEYDSGPGRGATNWAGTYYDAAFLAASVVQALLDNVTMFLVYNLQSTGPPNASTLGWGLVQFDGIIGPEGLLYSLLLSHFATGSVYATSLATTAGNVWSVLSENATTRSFLFVNANVTEPVVLSLGGVGSALGGGEWTSYAWQPGIPAPVYGYGPGRTTRTVPPMGMLLIDAAV